MTRLSTLMPVLAMLNTTCDSAEMDTVSPGIEETAAHTDGPTTVETTSDLNPEMKKEIGMIHDMVWDAWYEGYKQGVDNGDFRCERDIGKLLEREGLMPQFDTSVQDEDKASDYGNKARELYIRSLREDFGPQNRLVRVETE